MSRRQPPNQGALSHCHHRYCQFRVIKQCSSLREKPCELCQPLYPSAGRPWHNPPVAVQSSPTVPIPAPVPPSTSVSPPRETPSAKRRKVDLRAWLLPAASVASSSVDVLGAAEARHGRAVQGPPT